MKPHIFVLHFLCSYLSCITTANITFTSILYPQFIYMIYITCTSHDNNNNNNNKLSYLTSNSVWLGPEGVIFFHYLTTRKHKIRWSKENFSSFKFLIGSVSCPEKWCSLVRKIARLGTTFVISARNLLHKTKVWTMTHWTCLQRLLSLKGLSPSSLVAFHCMTFH